MQRIGIDSIATAGEHIPIKLLHELIIHRGRTHTTAHAKVSKSIGV